MTRLAAIGTAAMRVLKTYPALSAALINFAVFAAGYFGLHITAEGLVAVVGALDMIAGAIVHSQVTPVAKINPPAASAPDAK